MKVRKMVLLTVEFKGGISR